MASYEETDFSAKRNSELNSSRRKPFIINGVGPQMLTNINRQLKQMTNKPETFSFSRLFSNRLDVKEQRTREADISFNQSGYQNSLPVQCDENKGQSCENETR